MEKPLRPVWAEINLGHAAHNVAEFKRLIGPDCQLMAVIKANAYGHGDLNWRELHWPMEHHGWQ